MTKQKICGHNFHELLVQMLFLAQEVCGIEKSVLLG